jgi:hypothetical protein
MVVVRGRCYASRLVELVATPEFNIDAFITPRMGEVRSIPALEGVLECAFSPEDERIIALQGVRSRRIMEIRRCSTTKQGDDSSRPTANWYSKTPS